MRRAALLPAAGLLIAVGLALSACTSSPTSLDSGPMGGGSDSSVDGSAPELVDPGRSDAAADSDAAVRDVITTAQLDLVVEDPVESAAKATDLVTSRQGRIDSSTSQPASDYQSASASIVARVPADDLETAIDEISALGAVRSLSTQATDVTQQTTDLDARIDSLTSAVERLRQLLASAATTTDLIAIETALSEREAELESLTAQRDYLGDQVDYATVSISFTTADQTPPAGPQDFWGAVVAGFTGLVASLGALVIAFGVVLPWIVAIAIVAAIVIGIVRLVRRIRRRRPAATATATATDAPSAPSAPSAPDAAPSGDQATPPPAPGASAPDA
ncbi:DUF4349 domain-containing protein [Amnibacterium flavum]|nr:DUF4349 domain-containing protein [Amnibacterium flavum]